MPKKAAKKKSVVKVTGKSALFTAAMARQEYDNGKIEDREIFALEYPPTHIPMVGGGAFVRGEMFIRQEELKPEEREQAKRVGLALKKFLETVQEPPVDPL